MEKLIVEMALAGIPAGSPRSTNNGTYGVYSDGNVKSNYGVAGFGSGGRSSPWTNFGDYMHLVHPDGDVYGYNNDVDWDSGGRRISKRKI